MVQAVNGSTNPYYGQTSTQSAYASAPAARGAVNPYQTDGYSGGSYYAAPMSMASTGTLSAIVSDSGAASRFSLFMINSPERLLKVGGGMGAVGRGFLNLLAGNIPLFTSSAQRAQISGNVQLWLSSADLVRTGANAIQATLLQDVGVYKAQDLALYTNPSDQGVLAQRLAGAAAARGVMGQAPPAQTVGAWVQAAVQAPKYNY